MPIDLNKVPAPLRDPAARAAVSLDKHALSGHRARVMLALDYSGSMRPLYRSGRVQQLAERVLALATRVDDDGAIDLVLFGTTAWYAGALTLADYTGGIDRLTAGARMGQTNYAAAIHHIRDRAGAGQPVDDTRYRLPVLTVFVTDGGPTSRAAAAHELTNAADEGIFWAFLGVTASPADANPARFDFLRRLDTGLPGRLLDNASFTDADDLTAMTDDQLYTALLAEYTGWLPQARAHRLIH